MRDVDEEPRDVVQELITSLGMDSYESQPSRRISGSSVSGPARSPPSFVSSDNRRSETFILPVADDATVTSIEVFDAETPDTRTHHAIRASRPSISSLVPSPSASPAQNSATYPLDKSPISSRSISEQVMADRPSARISNFPVASKERDDGRAGERSDLFLNTSQSLSRMLASNLTHSPTESRSTSYFHGNNNLSSTQASSDSSSLPQHLYTQGLLAGKHSDISIVAFQHRYKLHRLVLDRAPFFTTALSGPWLESSAREIELYPEDTDRNITQAAFELALKHLYGCGISAEADSEAIGLFATGCWLEMPDLINTSISLLLKQMHSDMLSPLINILSDHYYGRYGERILESAKAMLCRDGWEMPLKHWDGIPGNIVCEIVGGDGFFVQGEWERWVLAKRLLDRRLRQQAVEMDLLDARASAGLRTPSFLLDPMIRSDPTKLSLISKGHGKKREMSQVDMIWAELYSHPDITPIRNLLETGIHYVHLDFEQLQYIRGARDIFELPVLPDMVIANALWMQMELRQRVVNAKDTDLELGLSYASSNALPVRNAAAISSPIKPGETVPLNRDELVGTSIAEVMHRPGQTASQRSFVIPTSDCNIVWGADDVSLISSVPRINRSNVNEATTGSHTHAPSTFLPPDPRRFFAYPSETNNSSWQTPVDMRTAPNSPTQPAIHTTYPPFRFAVEFPNPRALKERKRVYSRTIFYAGSLWNVYIQKVRSQKNPQLGVYLHRARERGQSESSFGVANAAYPVNSSVDERIGQFERDMIQRGGDPRPSNRSGRDTLLRQRQLMRRYGAFETSVPSQTNTENDTSSLRSTNTRRTMGRPIMSYPDGRMESYITLDSDSDDDDYLFDADTPWSASPLGGIPHLPIPRNTGANGHLPGIVSPTGRNRSSTGGGTLTAEAPTVTVGSGIEPSRIPTFTASASPPPAATAGAPPLTTASTPARRLTSTIPPYSDPRPTIKTYFKIYSPSKGGRMLSVYESAPDKFDFSQSWGWRSGSLMLDEGIEGVRPSSSSDGGLNAAGDPLTIPIGGGGGLEEGGAGSRAGEDSADGDFSLRGGASDRDSRWRRRGEGSLRFMIVIGNL